MREFNDLMEIAADSEFDTALGLAINHARRAGMALPAVTLSEMRQLARGFDKADELLTQIDKLPSGGTQATAVAAAAPAPAYVPAKAVQAPEPRVKAPAAPDPRVKAALACRDELISNHLSAVNAARGMRGKAPLTVADLAAGLQQDFMISAIDHVYGSSAVPPVAGSGAHCISDGQIDADAVSAAKAYATARFGSII